MKRIAVALLFALTPVAWGTDRASDFVNDYLKKSRSPDARSWSDIMKGCSIRSYGMANLEQHRVTPETIFQSDRWENNSPPWL
jgi:hypothetical protein